MELLNTYQFLYCFVSLSMYSLALSARSSHTGWSLNLFSSRLWYLVNIMDTSLFFSIGTIRMNPKNAQVNVTTCLFLSYELSAMSRTSVVITSKFQLGFCHLLLCGNRVDFTSMYRSYTHEKRHPKFSSEEHRPYIFHSCL